MSEPSKPVTCYMQTIACVSGCGAEFTGQDREPGAQFTAVDELRFTAGLVEAGWVMFDGVWWCGKACPNVRR